MLRLGDHTNAGLTLAVSGVTKSFGRVEVLRGVDLRVQAGTVAAVLGPSGCGKTTLLRIIAGFETPDEGRVAVGSLTVANGGRGLAPERRGIGIVPQEGALFPHLSVAANVGFGLRRGRQSTARVDEMLDLVGLGGRGAARPDQLSGGQQQRVALARALAPAPSLILLDEPFSSLDAGLRSEVRDQVFYALRQTEATAVLVTHDRQEALSVADVMAVMFDGRIAQVGTPMTLYERPTSAEVARFVGDANVVQGDADGHQATSALGRVISHSSPCRGAVDVVVRPEQLRVVEPDAHGAVVGTVIGRSYLGYDGVLRVELTTGEIVQVRTAVAQLADWGDVVGLTVEGTVGVFASLLA